MIKLNKMQLFNSINKIMKLIRLNYLYKYIYNKILNKNILKYMKYFGTDGIRGLVEKKFNSKFLHSIGRALVKFYDKYKFKRVLLVGNDSRESSDYILSEIESVLLSHGISVENVGVCSSPSLAYLTKKLHFPMSMMISASHNTHEYNGIKFFNSLGEKLSTEYEKEIEYFMDNVKQLKKREHAQSKSVKEYLSHYITHLKNLKHSNISCIIDCAYGGTSEMCRTIFPHSKIINASYNGRNINHMSGCTNIDILRNECIKERKIGFALDGDGDRLNVIDEFGNLLTGDKILYILSKFFLRSKDYCIGTIYTNKGLENSLNNRGIKLIRSQVGDKFVYSDMKKYRAILGGENSGHIIIKPFSNTGDGLLTAIILCNIIASTKLTLNELMNGYQEFFQLYDNIKLTNKFSLSSDIKSIIKSYEEKGVKIIIRESGTEPLIRIMGESDNEEKTRNIIKNIKNLIKI